MIHISEEVKNVSALYKNEYTAASSEKIPDCNRSLQFLILLRGLIINVVCVSMRLKVYIININNRDLNLYCEPACFVEVKHIQWGKIAAYLCLHMMHTSIFL